MSEEIIIDNVNVAECRFLDEWEHCDICEKLCDSKCLINISSISNCVRGKIKTAGGYHWEYENKELLDERN